MRLSQLQDDDKKVKKLRKKIVGELGQYRGGVPLLKSSIYLESYLF